MTEEQIMLLEEALKEFPAECLAVFPYEGKLVRDEYFHAYIETEDGSLNEISFEKLLAAVTYWLAGKSRRIQMPTAPAQHFGEDCKVCEPFPVWPGDPIRFYLMEVRAHLEMQALNQQEGGK